MFGFVLGIEVGVGLMLGLGLGLGFGLELGFGLRLGLGLGLGLELGLVRAIEFEVGVGVGFEGVPGPSRRWQIYWQTSFQPCER